MLVKWGVLRIFLTCVIFNLTMGLYGHNPILSKGASALTECWLADRALGGGGICH
jgi:hypothetical protein